MASAQPKIAGSPDGGRRLAPHVQAAVAIQAKPAASGGRPVPGPARQKIGADGARPASPFNAESAKAEVRSAFGASRGVVQPAAVERKRGGGSRVWAGPSKKADKQKKQTERNQKVVADDKKAEVAAVELKVNFAANFNTHVQSGEASGTTHTGYHSQSTTSFEAFGVCNMIGVRDGHGIYRASCIMTGQSVAKESTFFPDGWDIARIRREVTHACSHPVAPSQGAAWCGSAATDGIIIGGLGPKSAIMTAFPII
ncbi:MAG TPA: EndoU domain-containing protein [Thermoanaerobaculia bacterium]|nr:EndoU domain-containing protein [Thermoanaerobaculia bacterium]